MRMWHFWEMRGPVVAQIQVECNGARRRPQASRPHCGVKGYFVLFR